MTDTTPIRKSVEVPLSAEKAFDLFTTRMDTWWPLEQKGVAIGRGLPPSKEIRVEPREGGTVTEMMEGDEEALWGTILTWEPGARFRMTWCPGRSADMPTEVDVTFTELGNGCRVELTHSGFDAYENGGEVKAMYNDGWAHLVQSLFAKAALVPA